MDNNHFVFILSESPVFHKFIYNSQIRLPATLKRYILHNSAPPDQSVYFVCDLYSRTAPQMLSRHILVQRPPECSNAAPDLSKFPAFIIDTTQTNGSNVIRQYVLENVHILNVPRKKRENILYLKLKTLQEWKSGHQLTDEEKLSLRDEVRNMNSEVDNDDKVYLGVTAYVNNRNGSGKIAFTPTDFSGAIYNSTNSVILDPFVGHMNGGSEHVLRMKVSWSANIQVRVSDDKGWSALATCVSIADDRLCFRMPPYGGFWHDTDDTRLVHINVIGCNNDISYRQIKFLYRRPAHENIFGAAAF